MREMGNKIYPNSNRPLYLQLKDILIEKIESGELEPGDSIPGERMLAEMYDISRVTVRKCIGNMVEEGYLIKSQGRETRVADRKINHRLGRLIGVAEELAEGKRKIRTKSVYKGYEIPSYNVQRALNLEDDEKIFRFDRVIYSGDSPLVLNYSYVPEEIGKNLENLDLDNAQIFQHLERCGYCLSYAEQEISAGVCRKEETEFLEYERGNAVLVIKRTTYLEDGTPIIFERSIYRGDAYQYSIQLYRKLQ